MNLILGVFIIITEYYCISFYIEHLSILQFFFVYERNIILHKFLSIYIHEMVIF